MSLGYREGSSLRIPPHRIPSVMGSQLPPLTPDPPQPNECIKTLADMKVTLKELCTELREERRGASELQQQFTKAKAAWEMERAELKCHIAQVGAPGTLWAAGASPLPAGGRGAGGLPASCARRWLLGRVALWESQLAAAPAGEFLWQRGWHENLTVELQRMLFIPLLGLSRMGGMVAGLSSPPQGSGSCIGALLSSRGVTVQAGAWHPTDAPRGTHGRGEGGRPREGSLSTGPLVPQPCPQSEESFPLPCTRLAAAHGHPSALVP